MTRRRFRSNNYLSFQILVFSFLFVCLEASAEETVRSEFVEFGFSIQLPLNQKIRVLSNIGHEPAMLLLEDGNKEIARIEIGDLHSRPKNHAENFVKEIQVKELKHEFYVSRRNPPQFDPIMARNIVVFFPQQRIWPSYVKIVTSGLSDAEFEAIEKTILSLTSLPELPRGYSKYGPPKQWSNF